MKKRLLPLLGLFSGCVSMGIVALSNVNYSKVSASINPYIVAKDDFNDSNYKGSINTNIWTSKTVTSNAIHQSYAGDCYLENNAGSSNVETCAFATNRVIQGIKSFQFDMKYSEDCWNGSNSKWVAVYFVNDYDDIFHSLAYDGVMRTAYNAIFNAGSTFDKANFNYATALNTNLIDSWLTIKIDITSSTSGTINACVQGGTFNESNAVNFTYNKGVDLQNAIVGVSVSNDFAAEIRMDNFILKNMGETITEDFTHCDPTDPESDFVYKVTSGRQGDLSFNKFKVIDNSTLEFDQATTNDCVYTNNKVEEDKESVKELDVIDLTFTAKITQNNYKLGVVFGYDSEKGDLFKNTLVYELTKYNGYLKEFDEEGNNLLPEATNKNDFSSLAKETEIRIKINKKNGISIYENSSLVTLSGQGVTFGDVNNYYGNVALVLLAKGSATPVSIEVDKFELKTNTYYVPVTKSVTHNFSNNYWGNKDNPDFYVHDVQGAGKQTVKDGKLVWNMASDGTFFGSAHQYDNFILDFKLCSIYGDISESDSTNITAKNKWIGLDLSRSIKDYSTYSSYANILTVITADDSYSSIPVWVNCSSSSPLKADEIERKNYNPIPLSMFRDITYADAAAKGDIKAEDAVCFRYVSEGGNITMYLKKASDVTFTKIMTLYNLQLKGYFALCCTGYTFLEIDDFSMSNTSPNYVCADNDVPETITEIVTEVIYDNQNNDVNLTQEIKVNSGLYFSLMITFACVAVAGVATSVVILVLRKKGKKHE